MARKINCVFLSGTMPLVVAVVQPLWGVVADRHFGKKTVYTVCRVISTIILITLALPAISSSFQRTLAVSLAMSLFSSGGVLDAYALQVCGDRSRHLYGRLRMWTAVSLPLPLTQTRRTAQSLPLSPSLYI
jgi:MFS family permease